jgi:hypothetical protein
MKDCSFAWQGLYKGHHIYYSVVLESLGDQDMWIWHSFFRMMEPHNDITVDRVRVVLRGVVGERSFARLRRQ